MRNPEKLASRWLEGFCLCCFQSASSGPNQSYISEEMSTILQTLSRGTGAQTARHLQPTFIHYFWFWITFCTKCKNLTEQTTG